MRLLDTSGRRGTLTSGLGSELLAGSLATSGLTGSLLSTGHCRCWMWIGGDNLIEMIYVVDGRGGWRKRLQTICEGVCGRRGKKSAEKGGGEKGLSSVRGAVMGAG